MPADIIFPNTQSPEYEEGQDDYHKGVPDTENPYHPLHDPQKSLDWRHGWIYELYEDQK